MDFEPPPNGKDALMQADRSGRLTALALGTTAIFDLTGAVIYRVLRSSLPAPPPPEADGGPFEQASRELRDAQREAVDRARSAVNHARDPDNATLPT